MPVASVKVLLLKYFAIKRGEASARALIAARLTWIQLINGLQL